MSRSEQNQGQRLANNMPPFSAGFTDFRVTMFLASQAVAQDVWAVWVVLTFSPQVALHSSVQLALAFALAVALVFPFPLLSPAWAAGSKAKAATTEQRMNFFIILP